LFVVGEIGVFQLLFGIGAAAVVVAIARLAALASDLAAAKAPGAARGVMALLVLLAVVDGSLTGAALIDAQAGVREAQGEGSLRRELATLTERLERDRQDEAVLLSPDLAAADPTARLAAIRDAQRVLRLPPDGDYGPRTEARLNERLDALARAIPGDVARQAEIEAELAAIARDVVPAPALWAIAALLEVSLLVLLAGLVRAAPRQARSTGAGGRRKRQWKRKAEDEAPLAIEADVPLVPVRAHAKSTAPNGVREYVRRRRGGGSSRTTQRRA
jgi:hypothetical protein